MWTKQLSQHITTTCVSSCKKKVYVIILKLLVKFLHVLCKPSTLSIGYCTPQVENKIICETKVFELTVVHSHCKITWVVFLASQFPYCLSCGEKTMHWLIVHALHFIVVLIEYQVYTVKLPYLVLDKTV